MLLSDSIIWLWGLDWSINSEDLAKHFTQVSLILTSCSILKTSVVDGSRRAKITHKNRKKLINLIFWTAGCSLLRAEGVSCSLEVL